MNTSVDDAIFRRIWGPEAGDSGPLIIAEIGTAHQGSISKALELVDAAEECGADCVKFQHVYADEIIHPNTGIVPLPGGDTPLYEVFRSLETGISFLEAVRSHAEKRGLAFLCTPFGEGSLKDLLELGCESVKIASPELNHLPLLEAVAQSKLGVILSTGVSRLADIEEALGLLSKNRTALLHCVTSYPAPPEEYNLSIIPHLSALFGVPVGVSDHSLDPLLVPLVGLHSGAVCIEKHFTIDKQGGGLDDPVALAPKEFTRMSAALRQWAKTPGDELATFLLEEYGRERINGVLGNGKKVLAPSEEANYGLTNRSLHAIQEIQPGTVIDNSNIAVLRTEKELRPGLHPRYLKLILGRSAVQRIPDGEGVRWEDLL